MGPKPIAHLSPVCAVTSNRLVQVVMRRVACVVRRRSLILHIRRDGRWTVILSIFTGALLRHRSSVVWLVTTEIAREKPAQTVCSVMTTERMYPAEIRIPLDIVLC